jgi:hypothetical protein
VTLLGLVLRTIDALADGDVGFALACLEELLDQLEAAELRRAP